MSAIIRFVSCFILMRFGLMHFYSTLAMKRRQEQVRDEAPSKRHEGTCILQRVFHVFDTCV
jgi:hypothetical protein